MLRVGISHRLLKQTIEKGHFPSSCGESFYGVYITRACRAKSLIYIMQGQVYLSHCQQANRIRVGECMYLEDEDYGVYLKTSTEPNITFEQNKIIALRDIEAYEELLYHPAYNTTNQGEMLQS